MRHASLIVLSIFGAALTTSCSTQAASRTDGFTGVWAYQKACADKHSLSIEIKESQAGVVGSWSEGTRIRGSDGELSGSVRDGKLYIKYCSIDGEVGYAACPKMGEREDYFILKNGNLVRFRKSGPGFEENVTLHHASTGKEMPIDHNGCEATEGEL